MQTNLLALKERKEGSPEVWEKYLVVMSYGKIELYQEGQKKPPRVYYLDQRCSCSRLKQGAVSRVLSASRKLGHRLEVALAKKQAKVRLQLAFRTAKELEVTNTFVRAVNSFILLSNDPGIRRKIWSVIFFSGYMTPR